MVDTENFRVHFCTFHKTLRSGALKQYVIFIHSWQSFEYGDETWSFTQLS